MTFLLYFIFLYNFRIIFFNPVVEQPMLTFIKIKLDEEFIFLIYFLHVYIKKCSIKISAQLVQM